MKRFAVLIDAGYMLASCAEMMTDTNSRGRVRCDFNGLITGLVEKVKAEDEGELLRVYIYDANFEGNMTPEFAQLAEIPRVKVRLGRLVPRAGGIVQKGVDSRMVRDLIVLAYNRSITTAVLVTGDEDITEGVLEAQEQGLKVLGYAVPGENVSRRLCQELDGLIVLPKDFWEQNIFLRTPGEFEMEGTDSLTSTGRRVSVERLLESRDQAAESGFAEKAAEAGRNFAKSWKARANPREVQRLLAAHPAGSYMVPAEIDRELLRSCEDTLGFLWEQPGMKGIVRLSFWEGMESESEAKTQAQETGGAAKPA